MTNTDLRQTLLNDLTTLKRNLEVVPRAVLRTKYKKPYAALCQNISNNASAYAKSIVFSDIRIRADLQKEAIPLIQHVIDTSGVLPSMTKALFGKQDLEAFEQLILWLKQHIQRTLQPFYARHMGVYVSVENPKSPLPYSAANGCVWTNGAWIPVEQTENKIFLVFSDKAKA